MNKTRRVALRKRRNTQKKLKEKRRLEKGPSSRPAASGGRGERAP